jgi:anti-sigma regulatory factor (Ser/Thr protein kinase)
MRSSNVILEEKFTINGGDFTHAGEAASRVKRVLKEIGVSSDIVKRVAIATYEAEMNVVCYARKALLSFEISPEDICIVVQDEGDGIPDIELAMREGYSTASEQIREMGFGAGMGLPNIKKNVDELKIDSVVGKGTRLELSIAMGRKV